MQFIVDSELKLQKNATGGLDALADRIGQIGQGSVGGIGLASKDFGHVVVKDGGSDPIAFARFRLNWLTAATPRGDPVRREIPR